MDKVKEAHYRYNKEEGGMGPWSGNMPASTKVTDPTEYQGENFGDIEELFPTLVYFTLPGRKAAIKKEIDDYFPQLTFQYANEREGWTEDWGKTHQINIPDGDEGFFSQNILAHLPVLAETIDDHIHWYLRVLGTWNPELPRRTYDTASWMTAMNKGDFIHEHMHGACDLTGVFYYKTDGQKSVKLIFQPPQIMEYDPLMGGIAKGWDHPALEGKLLIFPAWLRHNTKRSEEDDVRYAISFNVLFNDGSVRKLTP